MSELIRMCMWMTGKGLQVFSKMNERETINQYPEYIIYVTFDSLKRQ